MATHFDAAILDLDGTLLDTMRYWRYTSLEYLLRHQLPVPEDALLRMHSTSARKLLPELSQRMGFPLPPMEELVYELATFMNRHYIADASLKDAFVPPFLRALKASGCRMCVATGSRREFVVNGLDRFGLTPLMDFITDIYEVGCGKDDPRFFQIVSARLNAQPENTLVVEDALYAMRGAKAAGCRVLAILDDTSRKDFAEIRQIADRTIATYAEILENGALQAGNWMDASKEFG